MIADHRDMVIADLADSEAQLRAQVDQLVDAFEHVAFDNFVLRETLKKENRKRLDAEAALDRLRSQHSPSRKAVA